MDPPSPNIDPNRMSVLARIRPVAESERTHKIAVTAASATTVTLNYGHRPETSHVFDRVLGPGSTQDEVFSSVEPFLDAAFDGLNLSVFMYGQTGTGKTHTMLGHDLWALAANHESDNDIAALAVESAERGIIPRAMQYIFDKFTGDTSCLKVSYLELYNERIRDLLAPAQEAPEAFTAEVYMEGDHLGAGLDIREDRQRGIHVPEATEVKVSTLSEVLEVLWKGAQNRAITATNMNEHSSRSRTVHKSNFAALLAESGLHAINATPSR